ncbi:MAG: dihydroorotase [Candidatus Eisenbacteria bacterium]|uniref:Dihydroorotase n=1 Tax=Eiseniibacteriota bacterium TaxID=2212470 RepID=A0A849SDT9_UNCEI|nr:dihydroorotase [Candidatus Eisenbacteria bacterium]
MVRGLAREGGRVSGVTILQGARHWKSGATIDVAMRDGAIVEVRPSQSAEIKSDTLIEAAGRVLAPGLVDLHVHLREPGQTSKESIATGTRAAAAGGFTAVACMPNTNPVVDNVAWVRWVLERAAESGHCRVHPIAVVTLGQKGEQLAEMHALAAAGAVAFSDDGRPVMSAAIMRRALEYSRPLGLPIVCHEEDLTLKGDGHMNEGAVATRLGIRGIPSQAESVMAWRDVDLAALTRGRVHLAHLSCASSFEALRHARRRGLNVTGETCPHYWMLTEEAVGDYDTHAKMNPPLRAEHDRLATIEAIVDGTIDCLTTDHAPHTFEEKRQTFDAAPFGIVGLETAIALTVTGLVEPGHLSLARAIELWTDAPRRVFGLPQVSLEVGSPADLVLLEPEERWTVEPAAFYSKGRNTPFGGMQVRGRAALTMCGGRITHALPAVVIRRGAETGAAVGAM